MGSKSSNSNPTTTTSQADNRVVLGNDAATVGAFGNYQRDSGNSWATAVNSGNTSTTDFSVTDTSSRRWEDNSQVDLSTQVTDSSSSSWWQDLSQSFTDSSNRSTNVTDTSSSSWWQDLSQAFTDSSNRSTNDNRTNDNHSVTNLTTTDGGSIEIARFNSALLQHVATTQSDAVKTVARFGTDAIRTQAQAATDLFATGSAEASKAWGYTVDASSELIDKLLSTAQSTVAGAQTVARDAIGSYQPPDNAAASASMKVAMLGAVAVLAAAYISRRA